MRKADTITEDTTDRLRNGKRVSVDEGPRIWPDVPAEVAREMMRTRIYTATRRIWTYDGVPVTMVAHGTYGVPQTEDDYVYSINHFGSLAHSVVKHMQHVHKYSQKYNLVPDSMYQKKIEIPHMSLNSKL